MVWNKEKLNSLVAPREKKCQNRSRKLTEVQKPRHYINVF